MMKFPVCLQRSATSQTASLTKSEKKNVSARNEFIFEGKIDKNNYQMLQKVAEWAISTSNVYREIEIVVKDENNGNMEMRRFVFDEVFCIDYSEIYGNTDGSGANNSSPCKFKLFMAQNPIGTKKEITCPSANDDDE